MHTVKTKIHTEKCKEGNSLQRRELRNISSTTDQYLCYQTSVFLKILTIVQYNTLDEKQSQE